MTNFLNLFEYINSSTIITLITLKLKIGSSTNISLYVTILRLIHHESINHSINSFTVA